MCSQKPKELLSQLVIKRRVLLTAGPTNMNHRIRAAMTLPILSYSDPQLQQILKDIVIGIRYILQTKNHYTFAITGPTSLAFETAICNAVESNSGLIEKIMVVVHGVSGERMAKLTKSYGYSIVRVQVKIPGDLVEKENIKNALEKHKPKVLYICHGDRSSGTLQQLRGIGSLCHEYDCLFMVDVSTTVCCAPFNSDQLDIDIMICGTQYALGLSPGLTLMSFSTRAAELIRSRKKATKSYCMNFNLLANSWGLGDDSKFNYHYTPSVTLLYALRESLAMVVEEGLDQMIERHMRISLDLQKEISEMGLEFFTANEKNRLPSVLVIIVPEGIKRDSVVDYMFKNYDIVISKGVSPIDKVWRIGIFGENANRRTTKLLSSVLKEALEAVKTKTSKESAVNKLVELNHK